MEIMLALGEECEDCLPNRLVVQIIPRCAHLCVILYMVSVHAQSYIDLSPSLQ